MILLRNDIGDATMTSSRTNALTRAVVLLLTCWLFAPLCVSQVRYRIFDIGAPGFAQSFVGGINNGGEVLATGVSSDFTELRAFILEHATLTFLPGLGGSFAE